MMMGSPRLSDRGSGLRGLAGAAGLVAGSAWFGAAGLASGFLQFPDRLVRRLPLGSTVVSGIALAVVVAVPYSALAVAAWRGDRRTTLVSFTCGLAMIGWIAVEVLVVREFSFLQPVMGGVGIAFAVVGRRGRRQSPSIRLTARERVTATAGHRHLSAGDSS